MPTAQMYDVIVCNSYDLQVVKLLLILCNVVGTYVFVFVFVESFLTCGTITVPRLFARGILCWTCVCETSIDLCM